MRAARLLIFVAGVDLLICVGAAYGDGGVFIRRNMAKYADIFQPTQKVYIRWDGSQEKLLIQTKYEGPAEEMVWLVPIPSEPTVERADGAVFNDLSKETYDLAIDFTNFAGLDMSYYSTFSAGASGGGGSTSTPVEWHERIGDYDVALLRPVGGEDVAQWLNSNDFAVPEQIVPVLEDYVREGWWMVAARIHPEALTQITREKLAQGTLHPLEMTFSASACVYPMRLTRVAAGPVEELIYIEGPDHYVPVTLTDGPWEISIFGGPIRKVPQNYYLSDIERTVEILEGHAKTTVMRHLTKLRRVFEPNEMTEDIIFGKLDYSKWLTSNDPLRVAQAATHYGRHRDPNGIDPLLAALSPEALDQVKPAPEDYEPWSLPAGKILNFHGLERWSRQYIEDRWPIGPITLDIGCGHLQSCLWALGEIGVEHPLNDAAVATLLRCAQHDNELIRMEAWIALTKARNERLGAILLDQLSAVLHNGPALNAPGFYLQAVTAPMDITADWICRYGTGEQKDTLSGMLQELVARTPAGTSYSIWYLQAKVPTPYDWSTWILWRAACAQDARLIPALESLHVPCADGRTDCVALLCHTEAACGSTQANATVLRQILEDESRILQEGGAATGDYTSIDAYYPSTAPVSLRVQILYERGLRYAYYPMPSDIADGILRLALSTEGMNDWYRLYLLARIKKPLAGDKDTLLRIWNRREESMRLVIADVLYVWGDVQMLTDLYDRAEFAGVKSEIAWGLAELEIPEAASIIEEQVYDSWNPQLLALNWTFVHPPRSASGPFDRRYNYTPLPPEIRRQEQALWDYFHPVSGVLDDKRLTALKALAADNTLHAGLRFDLLGRDYGGAAWALPHLEQTARDLLARDSSSGVVVRVGETMVAVGDGQFMVDVCAESASDAFRRDILNGMLTSFGTFQGPVEGLLHKVWPQRYVETGGQSLLFEAPGDLSVAIQHQSKYTPQIDAMLVDIVRDGSLPAGYRVFLLASWPNAPRWVSKAYAEDLVKADMPEFLRQELQRRLIDW